MLDITRDKPVKVSVRVAVPVQDHPKFNFVGKLLGPKGNSMKRLQEDTMCKMAVLGRGSMRDRKKEEELRGSGDSRYAHLNDDLHVEISTFAAPAEAHARIAYALAEVRRFLVPDYHDDIRREQMWEMQALTATSPHNTEHQQAQQSTLITNPNTLAANETNFNATELAVAAAAAAAVTSAECQKLTANNELHKYTSMNANYMTTEHDCEPTTTTSLSDITTVTEIDNTVSAMHCSTTPINAPSNAKLFIANESDHLSAPAPLNVLNARGLGLIQPTLRGVKAINIAGAGRKRSLLGVPRFSMNPTKRSVMTLLARAKSSQSLHIRGPIGANAKATARFNESLMLAAPPFILHSHIPVESTTTMITLPKENIAQGV